MGWECDSKFVQCLILLSWMTSSDKSCRENQIAHHVFSNSRVHAHCMLDTSGYKYTLTICNTSFPL